MRNPQRKYTAFAALLAGLATLAIAAPMRAQFDATAGAGPATPAAASAVTDPAGGDEAFQVRSLEDVDIDALLAESEAEPEPAPVGDARARAEPAGERVLRAVLALRPEGGWSELRAQVEAGAADLGDATWERVPAETRRSIDELVARPFIEDLQKALLLALAVLLVGLITLRGMRGKGDLAVSIEYPSELRGTFSVRIAKSRAKAKAQNHKAGRITAPEAAQRAKREAGSGSRTERTMVSRETRFSDLAAGTWFITVDGFLQSADTDDVLGTQFEEREVRCRRRHTVRAVFDFHPKDCAIDVKVVWDRRPVAEALVAVRGAQGSVRYARGGPVRIGVGRGSNTLVVGNADRVAEHPIEVVSFQPQTHTVDLSGRENMLFTGCPPAVEPYLNGDVAGAARALEREGQSEVSNLLMARLHLERGQKDIAARHFEAAGRTLQAAQLQRELANYGHAASLFESAGETAQAAEMYRSAGDLSSAGAAYERANRFDSAVECYREGGDISNWIGSLERMGAAFEAAQVSIERDDWGRAIRSLQLVTYDDPDYPAAANLLVDAFVREGHLDLAAQKIDEIVRNHGADRVPIETCDSVAAQLADGGEYERALDLLEIVRSRDATYPNLATRIEGLRKRLSNEQNTQPVDGADSGSASAVFTSGFRYEILEEIGRGGMGIVFKARDQRLGRIVALKRLPDNLRNHPKAIKLFLREARAAAALNHPNIVTLFDAGHEGDTFYITMELLEGAPLQTILHKRKQLAARDVARLGIQVAGGLQYAHEQRIVHRDVKTGNLFFTTRKRLKIMDFGLAKMVEEVRRASTVIGGTPYYMAPEQAVGGIVDHRADIYALGVTLYELLTGAVPFADGDVAFHHRHTPPPDPREGCPDLPDAFAELILHMLAKDPDDRSGSAARVAERLQGISKSLG
jgi:tRNA A-37 threonylcarbamoyl transferase component Bud32